MKIVIASNNAHKSQELKSILEKADIETVWDNLMNTFNNLGYQEYLTELNQNVILRDEAFKDGIILTPAEKFPLE